MQTFKIRGSAIGELMTNDRSGKKPGKTAYSYVETWIKEQIYGRKKEIGSKYLEKGTEMELQAIVFASDIFGWGFVQKNDIHLENEYITGTPDLLLRDRVADIKCSWDCFTFPLFENDIPNTNYWWQLQGYMDITGLDKAQLVYCLMDSPENLIDSEARRISYKMGFDDVDASLYEEVKADMSYSGIPENFRIKSFEISRDDAAIKMIYERVEIMREYIKQLQEQILVS